VEGVAEQLQIEFPAVVFRSDSTGVDRLGGEETLEDGVQHVGEGGVRGLRCGGDEGHDAWIGRVGEEVLKEPLVDGGLVELKRGRGMVVLTGLMRGGAAGAEGDEAFVTGDTGEVEIFEGGGGNAGDLLPGADGIRGEIQVLAVAAVGFDMAELEGEEFEGEGFEGIGGYRGRQLGGCLLQDGSEPVGESGQR